MVRKLGYSYEDGGTKFYENANTSTRGVTKNYLYNEAHEMLEMSSLAWDGTRVTRTYQYDPAGRMTRQAKQETSQATVTWTYEWDALDRLTRGQKSVSGGATDTVAYAYNAEGLRVRRTDTDAAVTKLYSYQGNNIASVQTGSASGFNTNTYVYTVAPGMISNALERHRPSFTPGSGGTTESQYYQYDHRGNVAVVSDSTGKVKRGYQYDAFGNILPGRSFEEGGGAAPTDDILFTGKDWDPDLELYYFNARWYDAEAGRFTMRADWMTPAEEHPYVFCEGNPLISVDPQGFAVQLPIALLIVSIVALLGTTEYLSAKQKARLTLCVANNSEDDTQGAGRFPDYTPINNTKNCKCACQNALDAIERGNKATSKQEKKDAKQDALYWIDFWNRNCAGPKGKI